MKAKIKATTQRVTPFALEDARMRLERQHVHLCDVVNMLAQINASGNTQSCIDIASRELLSAGLELHYVGSKLLVAT